MAEASHARPHASTAVLPPPVPPMWALRPAPGPLPPSQPPLRPDSRRLRPVRPRPRRPWRPRSIDAPSSPPAPPMTVLLAWRSMVVTNGGACLILGRQDALLAVETRLWRWAKSVTKGEQKGSVGRREAGGQGEGGRHAHGARALELGGGGNGEPHTSGCRAKSRPRSRSSCCRRLRGAAHGGTSASTQAERVGLIT